MRLGILADIHEEIPALTRALAEFHDRGVDRVISLGDACDIYGPGSRTAEVVNLLEAAGAVGVWGNHDVGLCHEIPDRIRERAAPGVLEFMATMKPRLSIGGCHFSHVEPWLDPYEVTQLWWVEGPPETPDRLAQSFAAVPERWVFVGHFHRWLLATPEGRAEWNPGTPIRLSPPDRYFVVVHAGVSGWCAVFDTESGVLTPIRCA